MRLQSPIIRRRASAAAAAVLSLSLAATSCGGTKQGETESLKKAGLTAKDGESGLKDAGKPKRGGSVTYGVEADTTSYCLPEAQLAISGIMIVRAVYDTLTVPNAKGDYVPYLAKTIDHNDKFDEWTIKLRDGVKFHDGTKVDSTVVKNNLDAYRGKYEGRAPLLFLFVFKNIADVTIDGPMTVKVKTTVPWPAFPAYLFSSGRLGMMAQAQLDDKKTCGSKLIGTGPFKFVKYTANEGVTAKRNPDYWQIAPDGKPYPYIENLKFRVTPDYTIRNQGIESGDLDIMHTSDGTSIATKLKSLRDSGKINLLVSEVSSEVAHTQLNATKPPFDDIRMRKAFAMAGNRKEINQKQNSGVPTIANGPFASDSPGYVADPGFPKYDPAGAKKLVAEYKADGKDPNFNISCTSDPGVKRLCQDIQARAKKAGLEVKIITRDQAALINDAIGKKYQAMTWRNYPGGDPDINYVWWYGKGNPVNFSGYDDPEINRLLDEGRSETDPAKRKKIYQDITRRFASQVYEIWAWYTPWTIAENSKVHNILGPPLPGDDASKKGDEKPADKAHTPSLGLAYGHTLVGLWVDK